ncbi:MAG: DUF2284 domain-containing protein [bacterium]|nr:DUF2284 domain-containing protein [bacterium]
MINKIDIKSNPEKLNQCLEKYKQKSLEMGAARSEIIDVKNILVEDKIILKCQVPRCFGYGVCANCPPHALKPARLKEILKDFKKAVFYSIDVPSEIIIRDKKTIKERISVYRKSFKIVSTIESMAFYDGYYLSFGFASGSCRHTFCSLEENCQALQGKKCKFSLLSRPSMEAVGIDVFKMTANIGWDIYPIGSGAQSCNITKGVLTGVIIVG